MALCISEESQRRAAGVGGWECQSARHTLSESFCGDLGHMEGKKPFKCFHKLMQPSPQSYLKTFHHPEKQPTYIRLPLIVSSAHQPWKPIDGPSLWTCPLRIFLSAELHIHGILLLALLSDFFFTRFKLIQGVAWDSSKGLHSSPQLNYIPVHTSYILFISLLVDEYLIYFCFFWLLQIMLMWTLCASFREDLTFPFSWVCIWDQDFWVTH